MIKFKLTATLIAISMFCLPLYGDELENTFSSLDKRSDAEVLTVYYVSWQVSTATRIKPDETRKLYSVRFTSRIGASGAITAKNLLHQASGDLIKAGNVENLDCRWAIVLSNQSGDELISIYANSSFTEAAANGQMFVPSRKFRLWIKEQFGVVFDLDDSIK